MPAARYNLYIVQDGSNLQLLVPLRSLATVDVSRPAQISLVGRGMKFLVWTDPKLLYGCP